MKVVLVLLSAVLIISCGQDRDQASEDTQKEETQKIASTEVEVKNEIVKEPTGNIFEYGIYNAQRKGRVRDNPAATTGKEVRLSVLEHSETTDRIPLLKGTFFAYRYRIYDMLKEDAKKPDAEVRKVVIHPTMTLPDGSTTNGSERIHKHRVSSGQIIEFDGYVFNEDYELVEGEWIFQIWYRDQMMVEQKFTIYKPEQTDTDKKAAAPAAQNKI